MNPKCLWMAVLTAGLLSGCGATRSNTYYQLAIPGDAVAAADPRPIPVTLLLGPLRASHLYREDRIVYSMSGQNMGTYLYQRWGEPPTEMLVEVLLRELRASGRYRLVDIMRSNSRGDYVLSGHLYDFKEISGASLSTRVTVEWELRETKTGLTVWTHFYTHDEPAAGKDISAVVDALNRNAQRGLGDVKSGLDQYFSSHPPN
jgi:ABC-type uncharacterized transport system auxiliary subunit